MVGLNVCVFFFDGGGGSVGGGGVGNGDGDYGFSCRFVRSASPEGWKKNASIRDETLQIFSQFQKDDRELRTLPLSLGVVVVVAVLVLLVAELTLVPPDGVSADPSEVLEACRSTPPPPALGLRSRIAGGGATEVDD